MLDFDSLLRNPKAMLGIGLGSPVVAVAAVGLGVPMLIVAACMSIVALALLVAMAVAIEGSFGYYGEPMEPTWGKRFVHGCSMAVLGFLASTTALSMFDALNLLGFLQTPGTMHQPGVGLAPSSLLLVMWAFFLWQNDFASGRIIPLKPQAS